MNARPTELPTRFQKFFTGVAGVSLLTYCSGVIFQYGYSLQGGQSHTVWEVISLVVRVVLPLIVFAAGVRMSRGSWWRRFMIGALCANGALLAQTLLMTVNGIVGATLQLDYSLVEALLSLLTILLWLATLWVFRTKRELWSQRYKAYVIGIAGATLAYTILSVVSMMKYATDSGWADWSAMLIAHLVVIALALVAYFVLGGIARSQRLFRVVLVMMVGFMVITSIADIVSAVVMSQFIGGADFFSSSVYMTGSIVLPILAYVVALYLVRLPATKRKLTGGRGVSAKA